MSWTTLTQQLGTLFENNKTALGIQEVWNYPRLNFTGFPALHISPSNNSAAYETTTENERIYAYDIRVFYSGKKPTGNTDTPIETALEALYPIADAVTDLLDQENEKKTNRTVGVNLPENYTWINMFATPSIWALLDGEQLPFVGLTVRMRVSVDVI